MRLDPWSNRRSFAPRVRRCESRWSLEYSFGREMHLRRISSRNLWSCVTWEILGHRYCISRRLSFARHKDPIHPHAIAYVGTDLDFSVILRIAILSADEYILLARSTSLPCNIAAEKNRSETSTYNVSIKSKKAFDRKLCERTHLAKMSIDRRIMIRSNCSFVSYMVAQKEIINLPIVSRLIGR